MIEMFGALIALGISTTITFVAHATRPDAAWRKARREGHK